MKKVNLFFALAITIGFSSCSLVDNLQIEKRHYGKGYYVHVRDKHVDAALPENKTELALINENSAPVITNEKPVVSETQNSTGTVVVSESKKDPQTSNQNPEQHSALSKTENKKIVFSEKKDQHIGSTDKKPSPEPGADTSQIILLLLAIFLSPIAVFLKEGATNRFWIDLICWIVGGGFFFTPFFYGGGLLLFAIVFALLIVFDVI